MCTKTGKGISKIGKDVLKQQRDVLKHKNGRCKTGKGQSKTEKSALKLVILFKKGCRSAIAYRTPINELHARTSHAHFIMHSARTSVHIARAEVR